MVIKFKELRFKNILSYGAQETAIEFTKGINLISGKNGEGKCVYRDTKINIKMDEKTYNKYINIITGNNGYGKCV